ncbi:MAG TPA: DUF2115 domain-containing protein [Methanobacteriaceae archaeon]|nr:DUF2115 domain-containing protein [Methanobacteriaceae archaeon]
MENKIRSRTNTGTPTKSEILIILKEEARKVGLDHIMKSSLYLLRDAQYIQKGYREEYLKAYTNGFLLRIKEVKEDQNHYPDPIDPEILETALELLESQQKMVEKLEESEPAFFQIYKIISLYTTFILEEPVHQVGTLFPGGLRVKEDKGTYFCPVKRNNENNPLAVCPFCIAKQDEEV